MAAHALHRRAASLSLAVMHRSFSCTTQGHMTKREQFTAIRNQLDSLMSATDRDMYHVLDHLDDLIDDLRIDEERAALLTN